LREQAFGARGASAFSCNMYFQEVIQFWTRNINLRTWVGVDIAHSLCL
jgi:hypothetical protein